MTNAVRSADTEEARAAHLRLQEARALIEQDRDPDLLTFFDALYAGAVPEDVLRTVRAVWRRWPWRCGRKPPSARQGAIRVAALDESHETVLVGINDDRPFLFDSALQAAMAGGARIRAAFHPIIDHRWRAHQRHRAGLRHHGGRGARKTLIDSLRETFAARRRGGARLEAHAGAAGGGAQRPGRHPPAPQARADISEDLAFLDWLADNHFTFLGARDYVLGKDGANGRLEPVKGSGLGVLADEDARVIRRRAASAAA